jgi:hypothetical protein
MSLSLDSADLQRICDSLAITSKESYRRNDAPAGRKYQELLTRLTEYRKYHPLASGEIT